MTSVETKAGGAGGAGVGSRTSVSCTGANWTSGVADDVQSVLHEQLAQRRPIDGFGTVRRIGEVDAVEFEHGRLAVEKGVVAEQFAGCLGQRGGL